MAQSFNGWLKGF